MANAVYPKYKEGILQSASNTNLSSGSVKLYLTRTAVYTYASSHQFLSDITGRHATASDALASKTLTDGTFDAADFQFTAPASDGNAYNACVLAVDTGSAATSPVIAYYDTGVTGLPVTPNGGNINITVNASGFFTL